MSVLTRESDSWLGAVVKHWEMPVHKNWNILADLWDLTLAVASEKNKWTPYPRPWSKRGSGSGQRNILDLQETLKLIDLMNQKG